jgi:ubiquinone/menaquinone biosynthesis C-methylase UbiE
MRRRRESIWLSGVLGVLVASMAVLAREPTLWYGLVGTVLGAGTLLVALWQRDALSTREVLVLAIIFRIAFLPVLPVLSDDAYRYVWDGMLQLEGINPYHYRPDAPELAAYHNTFIYERLNSATYYSVYPPLSQFVFAVGGLFYDWGWQASYFVIKGLFAAMEMGGVYLLASLVSTRNLMLYAWHPLAVIESAGQGHTEAAVVLFGVAALWYVRHGSGVGASLSIAAAAWFKLLPIVLLPLLWRRFGLRTVGYAGVFSVLVCAPYASIETLYHFASSLNLYIQLFEFNAGVYYGVKELFAWFTGADWSKTLGPALGIIYGVGLIALYVLDVRRAWSFELSALLVIGLFFICTTTVHPWYFLMILPFAVAVHPPVWAVLWLGLCAIATYLFYIDGPYWSTVAIGWGGAAVIGVSTRGHHVHQWVMQQRAARKAQRLRPAVAALLGKDQRPRILDLGAGEGYVGVELAQAFHAEVALADVVDMNRTDLPHVVYDGETLPWPDDAFDVTVLYFVLHHCAHPERVVQEARRVSRQGVIIVESTVSGRWQHRVLRIIDQAANRLRSGRKMAAQEKDLRFRTPEAWRHLLQAQGATIIREERTQSVIHPTQLLAAR